MEITFYLQTLPTSVHVHVYIHYAQTEFGLFFQMSAITVGCLDAYKKSVDTTCDSVDSSIKVKVTLDVHEYV